MKTKLVLPAVLFAVLATAAMAAAEVSFRDEVLVILFVRHVEAEGDHVAQVLVMSFGVAVPFALCPFVSHGVILLIK